MPTAKFDDAFVALTGYAPMRWQQRLYDEHFGKGDIPAAIDVPTGLGKTSVMAIWLIARALADDATRKKLPRRLVYVVDRRAVVDQATAEAEKLRAALEGAAGLKSALGFDGEETLPISTLRGRYADNRDWLADPASPAIIVGTVDMIGSRLLFEGYGVSRKMRPYHAGLLGADALIVLDEAHLVPPFAHLLRSMECDETLKAKTDGDRSLVPRFALLPLTATQRALAPAPDNRQPFRLEAKDEDDVARQRLHAVKHLRPRELSVENADAQFAEAAWALATSDGPKRVVIFCDRRDKSDLGMTPTALGVMEAIEKQAKADKKAGKPKTDIGIELLVGARRVWERQGAADKLKQLGFIGDAGAPAKPCFLIATAAGEVGVDIDADHMVSDIVPFERMVQRLGRVNRRGKGAAEVVAFWSTPKAKKPEAPTDAETRARIGFAAKPVLERLGSIDGGFDASPAALRKLSDQARDDAALKQMLDAATTPEPLRPALSRALVDAWSMTSLKEHTGRPEIAPWLRGWIEDDRPQTTLVWRTHLPVRIDGDGKPVDPKGYEKGINAFFEAAPPHLTEKLETETHRVVAWLQARAAELLDDRPAAADDGAASHIAATSDAEPENNSKASDAGRTWRRAEIALMALSPSGEFFKAFTLDDLAGQRKNLKEKLERELAGQTLIVDADFAGLDNAGMLDKDKTNPAPAADGDSNWSRGAAFRVSRVATRPDKDAPEASSGDCEWRFEDEFVLKRDANGDALESLIVDHLKSASNDEEARSISRPQSLAKHQQWAAAKASVIAASLGLPEELSRALTIAARLHDEGKRAKVWQRAFQAWRHAAQFGSEPLAKTRGPILQLVLDGYRHEFGSLPYAEKDKEFLALPDQMKDLVLHLIAAHHGGARPVIDTRGCEDAPPSALQERAAGVALRFARLQKRYGPWGLAWLEALLRAADQQASRDNDEPPDEKAALSSGVKTSGARRAKELA